MLSLLKLSFRLTIRVSSPVSSLGLFSPHRAEEEVEVGVLLRHVLRYLGSFLF